tara:strand:- start:213 stop:326 length:114 start_codon:yes stop_codon:yes gene_type:complete
MLDRMKYATMLIEVTLEVAAILVIVNILVDKIKDGTI